MKISQVVESKYFKVAAVVCGVFFVALLSFALGIKVGFYKASFSTRFSENYERNFLGGFEGRGGRMMSTFGRMMDADDRGVRNPHGIGGEILSISGDTLVIKDRNNQESSVRLSDTTIINRGKETLKGSDLAVGNTIVIIGKPQDDGIVAARLIRVFNGNLR